MTTLTCAVFLANRFEPLNSKNLTPNPLQIFGTRLWHILGVNMGPRCPPYSRTKFRIVDKAKDLILPFRCRSAKESVFAVSNILVKGWAGGCDRWDREKPGFKVL